MKIAYLAGGLTATFSATTATLGYLYFGSSSPKTITEQMIKDGLSLNSFMSDDKQYRAAIAFENDKEFLSLIGADKGDLNSKIQGYKQWCESSLKKFPNNDLVNKVRKFCQKKPYSNFSEILNKKGYVRLTEANIRKRYDELELDNILRNSITGTTQILGGKDVEETLGIDKSIWKINRSKFEAVYIKFCQDRDSEDFSKNEADYRQLFHEYEALCAKKDNN